MEQKQACVTGGQRGLGAAIASELKSASLTVFSPSSSEMDVSDPASVKSYFKPLTQLELLVCNAGIIMDQPLMRMKEDAWDRVMNVNLKGVFFCVREASKIMMKNGVGSIVIIASFSAVHPPVGQVNYAASKSALMGFMKSMALEMGDQNIRINIVMPGFLETEMTQSIPDSMKKNVLSQHTLGRYNTPDRVGAFITFLHHYMPHTSGQIFNLDSRIL